MAADAASLLAEVTLCTCCSPVRLHDCTIARSQPQTMLAGRNRYLQGALYAMEPVMQSEGARINGNSLIL